MHRTPLTALLALLAALALGLGLVACGDDDSSADSTTQSTISAEQAYAEALIDASTAVGDLGAAIVSGRSGSETASSIESAVDEWNSAISAMEDLDLTGEPASQRDGLVSASEPFADAWTSVAQQWESSAVDGALELVQQRSPIISGVNALQTAVTGAISEAGGQLRSQLDSAASEITKALGEIQSGG
jgi:hypothetical protein